MSLQLCLHVSHVHIIKFQGPVFPYVNREFSFLEWNFPSLNISRTTNCVR